jgi:hypothetical protein
MFVNHPQLARLTGEQQKRPSRMHAISSVDLASAGLSRPPPRVAA